VIDRNIKVEIRDAEDSAQEFVNAWRRAEAGEPVEEPVERLSFQDLSDFSKKNRDGTPLSSLSCLEATAVNQESQRCPLGPPF